MLFDLDSTLLNTYGHQEGAAFNYHYQAHGYHPLLCFDGITGDLLKMELRDGTHYCSKDADKFMTPLLKEYRTKYPSLPLYLRGDSGFAAPELYEVPVTGVIAFIAATPDSPLSSIRKDSFLLKIDIQLFTDTSSTPVDNILTSCYAASSDSSSGSMYCSSDFFIVSGYIFRKSFFMDMGT